MNLEDIYHEEGQDQDYEQAEYDNYLYSMGFFDLRTKVEMILASKNYPDNKNEFFQLMIENAPDKETLISIMNIMKYSPDTNEGYRQKDINRKLDDRLSREQ